MVSTLGTKALVSASAIAHVGCTCLALSGQEATYRSRVGAEAQRGGSQQGVSINSTGTTKISLHRPRLV